MLEQLGIPLLYLGDLFERHEIRDLLSLVSLDAESGGVGLVRVAQLLEYGATKADALAVIKWAETNHLRILEALRRLPEIPGLILPQGSAGLERLAQQLDGFGPGTSPWTRGRLRSSSQQPGFSPARVASCSETSGRPAVRYRKS